jgi:hypothetical protein
MIARNITEAQVLESQPQMIRASDTGVLTGLIGGGSQLRRRWPNLNLTRQNAIIGIVPDHAVIKPGVSKSRGVRPYRVDPRWKQ